MSDYDWSRFSARVDVKAGVKNIYAAWTTQMDLERWFLRVAEFTTLNRGRRYAAVEIQKGDRYRWPWHGYDDTVVERGVIKETTGRSSGPLTRTEAGLIRRCGAIQINCWMHSTETRSLRLPFGLNGQRRFTILLRHSRRINDYNSLRQKSNDGFLKNNRS